MHFSNYISDLLYRYECVIVPGFGAFLAHRVSAYHDETAQAFFPPKKRISFNAQLKENDGLLANYVASAEHLSYESALLKVQEFAENIQQKLNAEETLVFDKIGTLSQNEAGNLSFEPEQSPII
tara:strand:+ start:1574 stop:1945 length:372 start_codon:yes stop_codon:yes gene_type:complete